MKTNEIVAVPQLKIGSDAWLEYRRTCIGASEVGAVLGVSPWASPVDVWLEKQGRKAPFAGNSATYWGNLLEDLVAQEYAKKIGMKVRRHNFTLRRGVLMCDIDRLVHAEGTMPAHMGKITTDRAMDSKTSRSRDLFSDGLPMTYEAQGFAYMAVMPTVTQIDFATLFMVERELEIYPLARDDSAIDEILARIEDWWDRHMIHGEPPDPMSEADCKALWGAHRPTVVSFATAEVEAAIAEIAKIKQSSAELKGREEAARLVVFGHMQDAETLKSGDGQTILATWKSSKDSEKVDWKAVAMAAGASQELIAQHTTISAGSRRFLPKNPTNK